ATLVPSAVLGLVVSVPDRSPFPPPLLLVKVSANPRTLPAFPARRSSDLRTTTATVDFSTATLTAGGVISGDTVTLGGTAAGTFTADNHTSELQAPIAVVSSLLPAAGNYLLTQPTTTANFAAKPLTVSGGT